MTKIREKHWEIEEIESMTTEKIIEKLKSFEINFNKEKFLEQINNYFSACQLSRECYSNNTAYGLDEDFIWIAIMVLWKRLSPQKVNIEMIDDEMQRGYNLLENKEYKKTVDLWFEVWNKISKILPDNINYVDDADELLPLTQSIFNWSQDILREVYNYSLNDPTYINKAINFCNEFLARFKDDYFQAEFLGEKAIFLYMKNKKKEAVDIFEELLSKYPHEENIYFKYANTVNRETERVYLLAIKRGVEDYGMIKNLISYYEENEEYEKAKEYKERYKELLNE